MERLPARGGNESDPVQCSSLAGGVARVGTVVEMPQRFWRLHDVFHSCSKLCSASTVCLCGSSIQQQLSLPVKGTAV